MRVCAVLLVVGFVSADAAALVGEPKAAGPRTSASCDEAIEDARAAMDVGSIPPEKSNALYGTVHRASLDASCAARFADIIDASHCAGSATNAVAVGAFSSESFPPDRMAQIALHAVAAAEKGAPACARSILPAMQQAAKVDAQSRSALTLAAHSTDEGLSEAGFLVLGTAESIARAQGDAMLAASIDAELASALHANRNATLLEAAGNGACHSCAADVAAASSDADPWIRRAAIAAWRFAPHGAPILCAGFDDASPVVREHAAWALGLSTEDRETRIACLSRAAESDRSEEVRKAAAISLHTQQRESPISERR